MCVCGGGGMRCCKRNDRPWDMVTSIEICANPMNEEAAFTSKVK